MEASKKYTFMQHAVQNIFNTLTISTKERNEEI
jgi:hypothetical protein